MPRMSARAGRGGLQDEPFFAPSTRTLTYVAFDENEDALFVGDTLSQTDYLSPTTGLRAAIFQEVLPKSFLAASRGCTRRSRKMFASTYHDDQPGGRDATLAMPTLILPSIQVNVRAGGFPPAESNGYADLKLPSNAFGGQN